MIRFPIAAAAGVAVFVIVGCESSATPTSPPAAVVPPQTFTVSGIVSEAARTGVLPVSGALVRDTRSQRFATTDSEGRYAITDVLAGASTITVSKAGYVSYTSSFFDISADATLNVSVTPVATFILSGVVFETTATGRQTIEGVELYCDSCGSPTGHTFAFTDAQGRYQFAWSQNGRHDLHVGKVGYALVRRDGVLGKDIEYVSATVQGDTQLDIELERR